MGDHECNEICQILIDDEYKTTMYIASQEELSFSGNIAKSLYSRYTHLSVRVLNNLWPSFSLTQYILKNNNYRNTV